MNDVVEFQPKPPWERLASEPEFEYAWFVRFAELGAEKRSLEKVSALQGVPLDLVERAAQVHQWSDRASAYDRTVVAVTEAVTIDESKALAMQHAIGIAMMELGISAFYLKNPALLKIKDIRELMQFGAEMARRGAGIADLNIQHDVVTRVRDQVLDLLED